MSANERVGVFGRVRPSLEREDGSFEACRCDEIGKKIFVEDGEGAMEQALRASFDKSARSASARPTTSSSTLDTGPKLNAKVFEFDGIFSKESDQSDVFQGVGLPVLNAVLKGFHGCVFAYGQTGSGKTYTLLDSGSANDGHRDAGLLPRLVATLFVRARMDSSHIYAVEASSFQIYNEQVDDLLHQDHRDGGGHNLNVTRSADGVGVVEHLTWVPCSSAKQLLELFANARKNVVYAETKMNKASSRSHACFQLRLSRRHRAASKGTAAILSVFDLAGSERNKRSGAQGQQLKEACNINSSLLALGNVVAALAARKKHVPFRDSKLTRLLEGRVGGNCRTNLIVCASPSADSVSETVSALSFAARAMRVETAAVVNEVEDIIPDAEGLAVVPIDNVNLEEQRRQSKADADAALLLRKEAEDALEKERTQFAIDKEAAKKALDEALENERRAFETKYDAIKLEAEATLRREKEAGAKAQTDLITEQSRIKKLQIEKADIEHQCKTAISDKRRLETALEAATKKHEEHAKWRQAAEKREKEFIAKSARKEKEIKESSARLSQLEAQVTAIERRRQQEEKELKAKLDSSVSLAKTLSERIESEVDLSKKLQATIETLTADSKSELAKVMAQKQQLTGDLEVALQDRDMKASGLQEAKTHCDKALTALDAVGRQLISSRLVHYALNNAARETILSKETTQAVGALLETVLSDHQQSTESYETKIAEIKDLLKHRASEMSSIQAQKDALKSELASLREKHSQCLSSHTRESERQETLRSQLEAQLQALEERASSEVCKAETAKDAALADHTALQASIGLLEQRVASETKKNAALCVQVAQARDDNLEANVRYQNALQGERDRGTHLASELDKLVERFEKREPRSQDLNAIDKLRSTVQAERRRSEGLVQAAKKTELELEHERKMDRIFGPASAANRRQREQYRRDCYSATRPHSAAINKRKTTSAKILIKATNSSTISGAAATLATNYLPGTSNNSTKNWHYRQHHE